MRRQQDSASRRRGADAGQTGQRGHTGAAAAKALLEARVAEVALQRTQLEDLIQSLSRSRDENLLVDIEAALRMAIQQGAITGSTEPLVLVLRQSDERLARYSQPRLEGVRRAIARDLDRVKSAAVLDIAPLTIKLDEAMRMVDELPPLATAEPRREPARAPAAAAQPRRHRQHPRRRLRATAWAGRLSDTWNRLTASVWNEVRSLVRVTRIEHPDAALLAPEQAYFLRENLKLRLLNARLALLSRQFPTAQADLQSAQQALERYFDCGSRRTTAALELLRQVSLQARQTTLPRPTTTPRCAGHRGGGPLSGSEEGEPAMRAVIWFVLLFVVAVVAATTLGGNDGLVSIYWAGQRPTSAQLLPDPAGRAVRCW